MLDKKCWIYYVTQNKHVQGYAFEQQQSGAIGMEVEGGVGYGVEQGDVGLCQDKEKNVQAWLQLNVGCDLGIECVHVMTWRSVYSSYSSCSISVAFLF